MYYEYGHVKKISDYILVDFVSVDTHTKIAEEVFLQYYRIRII